jgi:hypothetical protein
MSLRERQLLGTHEHRTQFYRERESGFAQALNRDKSSFYHGPRADTQLLVLPTIGRFFIVGSTRPSRAPEPHRVAASHADV